MTVPSLRFKKFDRDWSINKIEEISIVTSGGTPSRSVREYWSGNIPWVTTSLVDFNVINEAKEFITQVGLDNSSAKLFPKDTILMAMYGQGITRGKVAILGIEATTNQACAAIKLKNGFDTKFIFQNLMNRYEEIRDLSNEGGQKNLSAGIIKEILISFPEKEEQTKIASFLSAVDEKISQLTQKHQLLSQYKQGMMQKLFSQQIRFKADDGCEFGEWEETVLEKIGAFLKGKGISKADIVEDGFTPCIRYGELYTHYGEVISKVISATNLEIENLILSKANDVLIPASGETQIDIATASCVLHDDVALSGDLNIFRTKENGVFLSYLIRSHLKMQIAQLAQGNSVVHLYSSQLKGVRLNLPCLEEQTKIANFLSAIDQKIEVVAQQIEQAKTWKKGLLQQMFV